MGHELAGKFGGNELHMVLLEVEAGLDELHGIFKQAIGGKIPFARCEQDGKCFLFEAKYHGSYSHCHTDYAKQHSAKHFEVSAECEHLSTARFVRLLPCFHLERGRFVCQWCLAVCRCIVRYG